MSRSSSTSFAYKSMIINFHVHTILFYTTNKIIDLRKMQVPSFSFQDISFFIHFSSGANLYPPQFQTFSRHRTPLFYLQQLRTALSCTNLVEGSTMFTQSTQTVQAPLMYIVTKLQPVGDRQWSRREWMALSILTAPGMTPNMVSVTWSVNFELDWTR